MLALSRRPWWALLVLLLLLLTFGACKATSTATPESTSTPFPTPTATPIPLPEPILFDPDENLREFFQSIPLEEQQCMTSSLGQAKLDELLDGADLAEGDDRAVEQCVSQETLARTLTGLLANQVGGLSDETLRCVWGALAEADLKGLVTLLTSGSGKEGQLVVFLPLLSASLCLTDEELARAGAMAGTELPLAAMRCLASRVDAESLKALSDAQQGSLPLGVMAAMLECGMEILGAVPDSGGGVSLSAEELACLVEALGGDQAVAEIMAGQRLPTLAELSALGRCNLDLQRLLGGS